MDIDLRVQDILPSSKTHFSRCFYMNDKPGDRRPLQEICGNSEMGLFSAFKIEVDFETGKRQSWMENESMERIDITGQAKKDASKGTKGLRCMKEEIPVENRVKELTVESNNPPRSEYVKLDLDASKEEFLKRTIKKALTEILSEVTSEGIDEISHDVLTVNALRFHDVLIVNALRFGNDTEKQKDLKSYNDMKKKLFSKQVTNKDGSVQSDEIDENRFSKERKYRMNLDKIDKVIQSLMEEVNSRRRTREKQLKRRLQKKAKRQERKCFPSNKRSQSPSSPIEVKVVPALERLMPSHREQVHYSSNFESQCSQMLNQEWRKFGMENQYKSVNEKDSDSWYSKSDKDDNCLWSHNYEQLQSTVGTLGWSSAQINYINKLEKRPTVGNLGWSSTQINYINKMQNRS